MYQNSKQLFCYCNNISQYCCFNFIFDWINGDFLSNVYTLGEYKTLNILPTILTNFWMCSVLYIFPYSHLCSIFMLCLFIFLKSQFVKAEKTMLQCSFEQNCSNAVIKLSFSFLLCEKKYKKCMVCNHYTRKKKRILTNNS